MASKRNTQHSASHKGEEPTEKRRKTSTRKASSPKTNSTRIAKSEQAPPLSVKAESISTISITEPSLGKTEKKRSPKYDYSTGALSPYPDWVRPTPSEVEIVFNLLEAKHGKIELSETKSSLMLAIEGCNDEEPSLLDVVIRVRLTAGTNDVNASRAFMGLLDTFGRRAPGSGLGIVAWDAVRLAPLESVYQAIKVGGMGNVKSKSIKGILDMVFEENLARQRAGKFGQKKLSGINLLSLEHMRDLSKDEAFEKLTSFPGVGPKTAACVISISMQHNSFAVDTHVFRICSWLGWAPTKTDRDGMFAHLETKIPDHLKRDLHFQLIRHGRACGRCAGNATVSSKKWEDESCPIEHLVVRKKAKKV